MKMENSSDTEASETNLIIITKRDRFKLFCIIYWRNLIIIVTPLILLPVAFIEDKNNSNAYLSFYICLVNAVYILSDAMHPVVESLVPIALSTFIKINTRNLADETYSYIRSEIMSTLCIMIILTAIEHSHVHRRIALKILLVFGCSHYRLSCLLFFFCTFLSLWVSSTMACGLMMPIIKAILSELEKMGILEIYHTIGKSRQKSKRHEELYKHPRPTDYTVFYFLGIAYSASIGGMATLIGSHTNIIFKKTYEKIFPLAPKIEYPHFLLFTLPWILLMEVLLYMWMNFYFLGMFRAQSQIALEIGLTEEEALYIHTLLSTQYKQLGKVKFHEIVVCIIVAFCVIMQATKGRLDSYLRVNVSVEICVILLFLTPVNCDFLKFLKKHIDLTEEAPLPTSQCKGCLNWTLVKNNVMWRVLFIIGGGCTLFYIIKETKMTDELERFLLLFEEWPAPALALVVMLLCKALTEFGTNPIVVHAVLPNVARLSVQCRVNPHYLLLAATLASSIPFHLVTGAAANALAATYVHIPPWKMIKDSQFPIVLENLSKPASIFSIIVTYHQMQVGCGPTLIGLVVIWFMVTLWSKAVWIAINLYPEWADHNNFNNTSL